MYRKILTVARPEWHSELLNAIPPHQSGHDIEVQSAAEAVISLATNPSAYHALMLDPQASGPWYDTLLDLTLGDTENTIRLLMLSDEQNQDSRLSDTVQVSWPVSAASFSLALDQADKISIKADAELLLEAFSNLDSIRVRYQPVVRFRDMKPSKVEVLARVALKNGMIVGPDAIVKAMTSSEYSMSLTGFIIQLAMAERRDGSFDDLDINFAFNLPLDALLHPQLLELLEAARIIANISPKVLRFELTETQPVTNLPELASIVTKLRDVGYRLSLDDIIPETPNLAGLLDMPFRAVKLDRSVVANAQHYRPDIAASARQFILSITSQAQQLNRTVIAEGIENAETLNLLRSLGVTHGQGYFFARPLPARALKPWLNHWNSHVMGGGLRA